MKKSISASKVVLILCVIFLILPILATVLYSIATNWSSSVLPEGYTFKYYVELITQTDFIQSFLRSLFISVLATSLGMLIIVPFVYIITSYFPKKEKFLKILVAISYCVPGIILVVGLIKMYSPLGVDMIDVVVLVYVESLFPIIYQSTKNNLIAINTKDIIEMGQLLGASHRKIFTKIIVPCLSKTLIIAFLLCVSVLFGEFTVINLLVGAQFETLQILLLKIMSQNSHVASAISVAYFLIMGLFTFIVIKVSMKEKNNVIYTNE